MAYTTINKSSLHFNTKLYTGNGSTQALTGVGFQPDWVWLKDRNDTSSHRLYDVVRGVTKRIQSNTTAAEATEADGLTAFGTDGFTLGSNAATNANSTTYVSWNWKAGNSQGSSNTDGSINTTYTSVNTTAGFSIGTYTGNNSNAQTIGHGLGVAPKMYMIKRRDSTSAWGVYHASLGENKYLQLETTNAEATDTGIWNNTAPTSTVLSLGNAGYFNNASGGTYVCYAFAEKKGYSKFGSYTGNGNADGTFVYTGFKPAFVMCKRTDGGTQNWCIMDNKRGYNPDVQQLHPNNSNVESLGSGDTLDLLSNGFKMRVNDGDKNGSGETFIYMAFGQSLVGSNNIPCTAR
jgi:hypothetical protein